MGGVAEPPSSAEPRVGYDLRFSEKKQLVDGLKALGPIADSARRRGVVSELRSLFPSAFDATEISLAGPSPMDILNKCLELRAVPDLVDVLEMAVDNQLDDEVDGLCVFRQMVTKFVSRSFLRAGQREQMLSLAGSLSETELQAVLRSDGLTDIGRSSNGGIVDLDTMIRRLEMAAPSSSGLPASIVFLDAMSGHLELSDQQVASLLATEIRADLGILVSHHGESEAGLAGLASSGRIGNGTTPLLEYLGDGPDDEVNVDLGEDVNGLASSSTLVSKSPPLIWGGVPQRNTRFVGRAGLIADIREHLATRTQTSMILQNAIFGLGGVGKTQVATEYCHREGGNYRLVWWIPADDEHSVVRSFLSLARKLELPQRGDSSEYVEAALDALRYQDRLAPWLLVFDNAENPDIVRRYLPGGAGDVLITSRSNQWKSEMDAIEVGVFDLEDSVELLTKRWPGLQPEQALELAERLGNLPLALVQAASFHAQTGCQFGEYVKQLDQSIATALDEGVAPGYADSVAATFRLISAQLAQRSPAAARLLQVCSFIGPHEIAVSLLSRGGSADLPEPLGSVLGDDMQLRRAIGELGRFSMMQLDNTRDFVSVHRLVAGVVTSQLSPEDHATYEAAAHELLASANPGSPDQARFWAEHAQIAPHIITSDIIMSPSPRARQVVLDQIRYLYNVGKHQESRALAERTVESWRGSFGPDDRMTLIAARLLGNALRSVGSYTDARDLDRRTLDEMAASNGFDPDDPHRLAVAMSFGADLRLQGEFAEALTLDSETHDRLEALDPDDATTLRAANNLAVDYGLLGRYEEARSLNMQLVERRSRVYRPDHRETLFSYRMLVRDLYNLGFYQQGLDLQREKLEQYVKSLTLTNHPDLLYARRNMAMLLRKTGDHVSALQFAVTTYDSFRGQFHGRHELTLAAMMTLANVHRVIGDEPLTTLSRATHSLAEARKLGEEALLSYAEVLGADHPFTHTCRVNLAIVYRSLMLFDEAIRLDEVAGVGLERSLGPIHPYTLCARANIANDLALLGQTEAAIALSGETLERSRAARPKDHPYTIACINNHARNLEEVGRNDEAALLWQEVREALLRIRGNGTNAETVRMNARQRVDSDIEPPEL